MKRLVVFVLLVAGVDAIGRTAPAEISTAALADFFKPGVVFQDRNGDGAVDFVDARIVLLEHPTSAELAAAADIAARLGFETSAMNLPLSGPTDGPQRRQPSDSAGGFSIFVGTKSLARDSVGLDAIGGAGLKAGDGLVAAFTLAGR